MLGSENARDDEVVGKAGDGLARMSIALALSLYTRIIKPRTASGNIVTRVGVVCVWRAS